MMLFVSILNGRVLQVSPVVVLISLALLLWWIASRRGTYIAVDQLAKTLYGSNFFLRSRRIPIAAITRIATRGVLVGLATEIEITYRNANGCEKTIGYGTTNCLNHTDLKALLDALVAINPNLHVPRELQQKLSKG